MSNFSYTIRNYQPADFGNYVRLNIEAEKLEPTGRCVSPQDIAEHLSRSGHSPEQNVFVAEISGNIVGYLDVTLEITIGRVILACWVHPEHRRRGLATKFLAYAIHRAKELGARIVHVRIPQDNMVAKSVLSKLGFECVRKFLKLELDVAKVHWQNTDQAALQCRHLQRGEEDKLVQIQNRSFAGSWGYNPNTVEEITYRVNLSDSSPEDVLLAYEGDKVIGYCWTKTTRKTVSSERKGQIFMLGVDPDYRGKGISKRLLLAGLAYLKSKGLQVTSLTVDSRNKVAYALYRSVGFKVQTSSVWYEKIIS